MLRKEVLIKIKIKGSVMCEHSLRFNSSRIGASLCSLLQPPATSSLLDPNILPSTLFSIFKKKKKETRVFNS
jgi:hypothetical protein